MPVRLEYNLLARMTDPIEMAKIIESKLRPQVFEEPICQAVYSFMVFDYWNNQSTEDRVPPTVAVIEYQFPGVRLPALTEVEETTEWLISSLQTRYGTNALQEMMRDAAVTSVEDPFGTMRKLVSKCQEAEHDTGCLVGQSHLRDQVLDLDGLRSLPPVTPLIDGFLYWNTLAQLSGPPGCLKSFLALTASCCLGMGFDFGPFRVPRPATVVYAVAEGANGVGARILGWCEINQVDPQELLKRLHILPLAIQLGSQADVAQAAELVAERGADLLVLDTRARCTVGLEENSATAQGVAIEAAETIRRANSCTVWNLHHTPREGNAGRGSNAWDGGVWSDLRMKKEGIWSAVLHCEKHKDVADGCDHHFSFIPHTVSADLMPGVEEKERQTLVFVQKSVWTPRFAG